MKKSQVDKELTDMLNTVKADRDKCKEKEELIAFDSTIKSLERIMSLDKSKKEAILEGIKRPQFLDMERLYLQGLNNMLLSNLVSPEVYVEKIDRSDPKVYWSRVEKVFKDFKDLGIIEDSVGIASKHIDNKKHE